MDSVYRDKEQHCVLVVFDDGLRIEYIGLMEEAGEMRVELFKTDSVSFHETYSVIPGYPAKQAAGHFLNPLTPAIVVSEAARRKLNHITENNMSTTKNDENTMKNGDKRPSAKTNVVQTAKASVKTSSKAADDAEVAPVKVVKPTAKQQAAAKKKIDSEKKAAKETAKTEKKKATVAKKVAANAAKGKAAPDAIAKARAAKKAAKAKPRKPTPLAKKAKLVPSPKAAPKKTGGKKGRAGSFTEDQKITVLVKDNPKREGSNAHEVFEWLRKSKTVGEFYKKGGMSSNLRWNIDHKYIKVH